MWYQKSTKMSIETKTLVNSLKLVDGTFSPVHTHDLIKSFINTKINYHKLNRLIIQEGNHNSETVFDNERIKELEIEKANLMEAVDYAKANGKKIKLKAIINLEFTDK